jgi:hypothetical protein
MPWTNLSEIRANQFVALSTPRMHLRGRLANQIAICIERTEEASVRVAISGQSQFGFACHAPMHRIGLRLAADLLLFQIDRAHSLQKLYAHFPGTMRSNEPYLFNDAEQ